MLDAACERLAAAAGAGLEGRDWTVANAPQKRSEGRAEAVG